MDSRLGKLHVSAATKASSRIVLPAIGLFLLGLLTNLYSREEVYSNLEYGFSVLALLGAAGCIGHLAASIARRSGTLDFSCCVPVRVLPAAVVPGGISGDAGDWPVLVALLFGPLVVLLAGLGGWV